MFGSFIRPIEPKQAQKIATLYDEQIFLTAQECQIIDKALDSYNQKKDKTDLR